MFFLPYVIPSRMGRCGVLFGLSALAVASLAARPANTFDEAYNRLRQGRTYTAQASGVVRMSNRTADGLEHHFTLNVPEDYDPARKYQVRIQLHGGIGGRQDNRPVGTGTICALAGDDQIYIIPYAWNRAPWWRADQFLNLRAIVDAPNRVN